MLHRLLMIPASHCSASVGDTNIAMDGDPGANTVYELLPSDASTLAVKFQHLARQTQSWRWERGLRIGI